MTGEQDAPVLEAEATSALRERMRRERPEAPFFDRGPGYARLSGGEQHSQYDWL